VNGTLYISGQLPVNPETGSISGKEIIEQTHQVLKNIGAILHEAGYDYTDVVKSTCFLSDMDDFKAMNKVYAQYYNIKPPARSTYSVVKLPLNALIEIETIACHE
jgi:2-iminobutanoate/2-iminopropanoate deaminase